MDGERETKRLKKKTGSEIYKSKIRISTNDPKYSRVVELTEEGFYPARRHFRLIQTLAEECDDCAQELPLDVPVRGTDRVLEFLEEILRCEELSELWSHIEDADLYTCAVDFIDILVCLGHLFPTEEAEAHLKSEAQKKLVRDWTTPFTGIRTGLLLASLHAPEIKIPDSVWVNSKYEHGFPLDEARIISGTRNLCCDSREFLKHYALEWSQHIHNVPDIASKGMFDLFDPKCAWIEETYPRHNFVSRQELRRRLDIVAPELMCCGPNNIWDVTKKVKENGANTSTRFQSAMILAGGLLTMLLDPDVNVADLSRKEPGTDIDVWICFAPGQLDTGMQRVIKLLEIFPDNAAFAFSGSTARIMIPGRPIHYNLILTYCENPATVPLRFDLDCVRLFYDGETVWCSPQFLESWDRRVSHVSEYCYATPFRCYKYFRRGFAVPNAYKTSIEAHLQGIVRELSKWYHPPDDDTFDHMAQILTNLYKYDLVLPKARAQSEGATRLLPLDIVRGGVPFYDALEISLMASDHSVVPPSPPARASCSRMSNGGYTFEFNPPTYFYFHNVVIRCLREAVKPAGAAIYGQRIPDQRFTISVDCTETEGGEELYKQIRTFEDQLVSLVLPHFKGPRATLEHVREDLDHCAAVGNTRSYIRLHKGKTSVLRWAGTGHELSDEQVQESNRHTYRRYRANILCVMRRGYFLGGTFHWSVCFDVVVADLMSLSEWRSSIVSRPKRILALEPAP